MSLRSSFFLPFHVLLGKSQSPKKTHIVISAAQFLFLILHSIYSSRSLLLLLGVVVSAWKVTMSFGFLLWCNYSSRIIHGLGTGMDMFSLVIIYLEQKWHWIGISLFKIWYLGFFPFMFFYVDRLMCDFRVHTL